MTPFRHKMHHIKAISVNTNMFCEWLKPFLSRIHASVYGNPSRNQKVTRFDPKLAFLRKFLY